MNKSVLIIGAGISGIECAINIGDRGAHVYLLEDTSTIGGLMARLNKTFPTNDCSICIEAPKMYELQNRKNIELLTNHDVRRIEEKDGIFKIRLVKKPRYVDEEKCKGCGKCAEVCPISVEDEADKKIGGKRKLISIPIPQAVPNVYSIDALCRFGKLKKDGACIGGCLVDCIQCRECPIARCVKVCKDEGADAILLWQREKIVDIEVNSIVLATGTQPYDPYQGLYGYGIFKNVITHYQYERLTNAGGPTSGDIKKPSDNKYAKKITWIQCVGRDQNKTGISYCSKVCCMAATKQAIITKEHDESIETTVLYLDLKTYGKGFYDFYKRAKELGVKYIRGRPSDISEEPESGKIIIRFENIDTSKIEELESDILVLSVPVIPSSRIKKMAKLLKIELDKNGFVKEKDPIRAPFETNVSGIYACGGALGPVDISEAVAQAIAVGVKAISYEKTRQ